MDLLCMMGTFFFSIHCYSFHMLLGFSFILVKKIVRIIRIIK